MIVQNESLLVSKAMKKCSGEESFALTIDVENPTTLKEIINDNSQLFIDYIHKLGLHISHKSDTTDAQNSSTTILTLKTTCFKVDINQNLAKITPLK